MEDKILIAVEMFVALKEISCARYCKEHGIEPQVVVDRLVQDLGYSRDAVEYFMNLGLKVIANETV